MKKKIWNKLLAVLVVMLTVISLLLGYGRKSVKKEDCLLYTSDAADE